MHNYVARVHVREKRNHVNKNVQPKCEFINFSLPVRPRAKHSSNWILCDTFQTNKSDTKAPLLPEAE